MGNVSVSTSSAFKEPRGSSSISASSSSSPVPTAHLYTFPEPDQPLPTTVDLRVTTCSPYPKIYQRPGYKNASEVVLAAFQCQQRHQQPQAATYLQPSVAFNEQETAAHFLTPNQKPNVHSALLAAQFGIAPEAQPTASQALYANIKQWDQLQPTVENLKKTLAAGYAIIMVFNVTKLIDIWLHDVRKQRKVGYVLALEEIRPENFIDSHAVLIVGYRDDYLGGVFIIRNSWGVEWGDQGHFYLAYGDAQYELFAPAFYLVKEICANPQHPCVTKADCQTLYNATSVCQTPYI